MYDVLCSQELFRIDPAYLKSPINRPTKIIRELYKNSGHEMTKWRDVIEPNEALLKGNALVVVIHYNHRCI